MNYRTVKTSELSMGDLVLCHGMLCLIDQPIESKDYPAMGTAAGPKVYWTRALVTNVAELSDQWLVGVTREYEPWPNRHVPTGEHRWTIQGNDLATWSVVEVAGK
jgi:hypothetical protein